jgi:hypothetical protein
VESVSVLELGQDFTVVAQSNFTQIFMDGDSLTYTSIVVDQAEPVDVNNIPKVLQVNIFGFNAQNQPIVNWYAIGFSNNCVSYPVLEPGNNAGWTSFVSFDVFYRTLTFPTSTADSSLLYCRLLFQHRRGTCVRLFLPHLLPHRQP